MKLKFAKVHGAGNDFIVFAHPEQPDEYFAKIAPAICDRRKGIGADGILLIRREEGYDFRMVYFNSDGSRAPFCGNGARALVLFAWKEGIASESMRFVSDAGVHKGLVVDGKPSVSLPDPKDIKLNLTLHEFDFPLHFAESGVPHVVVLVENLASFDVDGVGRSIRNHPHFAPAGTNADFVQIHNDDSISVRTYERGVERETLACGTGAVAVATVLHKLKGMKSPIELGFPGGLLRVSFESDASTLTNVMLGGQTAVAFKGEIELP
ncbi:MAG: diaminopimelate epimerase [candidate division WOR-3 bacterium]|nr:diaminopimelate epimerase [candidate division WOR-3 bacterium]